MKTGYFNTGFVSLQYKMQTDIDQNTVIKLQHNPIFDMIFEELFLIFGF